MITTIVLLYIGFVGVLFFFQRQLMYFPRTAVAPEIVQSLLPQGEKISVNTNDGLLLTAYFVPPSKDNNQIMLVFHGNAALGIELAPQFASYLSEGRGLLLAEYRGYGGNAGQPTEDGLYKDADAYLNYLKTNYSSAQLIAYGQSLGSGVAVDLVSRHPKVFSGLVLEVPFFSAVDAADNKYPFVPLKQFLLRDKYRSDTKIGAIDIPKLFLLAGKDEVVGFIGGQRLYDLAKFPKNLSVYPHAEHAQVYNYGAQIALMDFIHQLDNNSQTSE